MVSDRALQKLFGFSPQGVERWGDLIRAVTLVITLPILASLTGVYGNVVRNTIEIRQGQDFGLFYESALPVPTERQGDPLTPNLNPPHFNILVRPFTLLDLPQALLAWLATGAAALLLSLMVIVRTLGLRGWAVLAACAFLYASAPMVATLLTGQVGLVLLLPFTIAWASVRKHRYVAAGVWIGVCASIKPFFILFIPYLVMHRQKGAAAASLVPIAALFGIGIGYYGIDAYRVWIADLLSVTWAEHYMNASVLGFLERSLSTSEWQQVPLIDAPQVVVLKRPRFSWTRIKGESNVQGGGGNGSVEGRGTGRGIGADGGSPEGDWSPCRRGGGRGGRPGAGAAVERQPEARRGAAATAWRIAGGAVP